LACHRCEGCRRLSSAACTAAHRRGVSTLLSRDHNVGRVPRRVGGEV
jgi:hypothetical protein